MLSCFVLSCVLYVCIYMAFYNLAASARAAAACSSISTCPPRSRSTDLLILNKKVGEPVLLQTADLGPQLDAADHVNKAASISKMISCISKKEVTSCLSS